MGVISDRIEETGAQGRPESEVEAEADPESDQAADGTPVALPERNDPFLQRYLTERFDADDETVEQVLTVVIAAANVFK
jgi:hypothetical protein